MSTRENLERRINRALAKQDEVLRTARSDREAGDVGEHYIVDLRLNAVAAKHVDIEELAGELGVRAGPA